MMTEHIFCIFILLKILQLEQVPLNMAVICVIITSQHFSTEELTFKVVINISLANWWNSLFFNVRGERGGSLWLENDNFKPTTVIVLDDNVAKFLAQSNS